MKRTKFIVFCSYVILTIVFVAAIVWVYKEWSDYHKKEKPHEQTELVQFSNTLSNMYRAQGTVGLLSLEVDSIIKQEYDSLMFSVFSQIDSLRKISLESQWVAYLDTLENLLHLKQQYTDELKELSKQISTITTTNISKSSIVKPQDIKTLNNILNDQFSSIEEDNDTSIVIAEKGGLFRRLGDAVMNKNPDTVQHISVNTQYLQYTQQVLPVLRDTIIEFLRESIYSIQKHNAEVTSEIVAKFEQLYRVNEETTAQINLMIAQLQNEEHQRYVDLTLARETALQKSSRDLCIFAIIAIILAFLFMTWVWRSISINQRLHQELELRKKHTENLLSSREKMMLMISHDIKVPISSILGYLELMKSDMFSGEFKGYIQNMRQSAVHILDLVRNMLEFHSIENKQQKKDIMTFSPYLLLSEIYQSFLPETKKKGLEYKFECKINPKESYISDPYRIRQIINNLIGNAIKYTPKKGTILLSGHLDKEHSKINLVVAIKDSGVGIKKADQKVIFEEFSRLGSSSSANIDGVGLGLHIANRLARLLGGSISLDSNINQGSTFTLTLPMDSIGRASIESGIEPVKKPVRVLFIDDDVIQLDMIARLMERERIANRTCLSASEALTLLEKEHFDIVFSDINMPEMTGEDVVKYIRLAEFKDSMTIPIVGLSGATLSEKDCKKAGFATFIEKPFTAEKLINTIYEYTGNKNMGFEIFSQFAGEDPEAGKSIIKTFATETEKNYNKLRQAFDNNDWRVVKDTSHKMLPLMKMISANNLVDLLQDYANGNQSQDNKELLLELVWKSICEANQYL